MARFKKVAATAAMALCMGATMVGTADAKHKTLAQRIAALEKTNKKQTKQIKSLSRRLTVATNIASEAADNADFLLGCLIPIPAGVGSVLGADTTATFDGTALDWLPIPIDVVAPGGPDWMLLADPGCIQSPAGASARRGRALRPAGRLR